MRALSASVGAIEKRSIPKLRAFTVKLPKGTDLSQAIARYRKLPGVEYAGPNHILRIATPVFPSDPLMLEGLDILDLGVYFTHPQWGLFNDGYNNGYGGSYRADIWATEAWEITTGSPDVVIAVLDTGLDYTHPDLADKVWINSAEIPGNGQDDDGNGFVDDWQGWDFANNDNDPMDDHSDQGLDMRHGTFTSGVAAASTDNFDGMAGVSWGSPIMALKVMDATGYGLEDVAAEAVQYAVDMGARVINMSLTGEDTPLLHAAIDYAYDNNALCICASGNAGVSTPTYPASYEKALSVGATNEYDQRCTAADWGQGGSSYGDYLDVMAPGNNILSATDLLEPHSYYTLPGTSAAAPFVAGLAALVWSIHPDWTSSQVFSQITRTADDIHQPGWDVETGWGRINAYRALTEEATEVASVSEVKSMADGTALGIRGKVLSTSSGELPGRLYIQEPDRSSGILLSFGSSVPAGLAAGDIVDVYGTVGVVSGELAILSPEVKRTGTGPAPASFNMTNVSSGGGPAALQQGVVDYYSFPQQMAKGLSNIGLLITVAGKVTAVGFDWFYLDDGAHLDDGTGNVGIYVHCGALQRPGLGKAAVITGISSCEKPQGSQVLRRVIRPRRQSDISVP